VATWIDRVLNVPGRLALVEIAAGNARRCLRADLMA
jgi:hypothetical protein